MTGFDIFILTLIYMWFGIMVTAAIFSERDLNPLLKILSLFIWPITMTAFLIACVRILIINYINEIKEYYRRKGEK